MNVSSSTSHPYAMEASTIRSEVQKFDFKAAQKKCDTLYKNILESIQSHGGLRDLRAIPLPALLTLVEVLSLDYIQCEDNLKYSISKTCNLLMQITFFKVINKRKIYPTTLEKIKNICGIVLDTLPASQVRAYFALRCCQASAEFLISFQIGFKEGIELMGPTAFEAVEAASEVHVFQVIAKLAELSIGGYNAFLPSKWVFHANAMSIEGAKIKGEPTPEKIKEIYTFYSNSNLKSLERKLCMVEVLGRILQQTPKAGALITSNNETEPGLKFFANYKTLKSSLGVGGASWKVRLCACQVLWKLIKSGKLQENDQKQCLRILSKRLLLEKDERLVHLLQKYQSERKDFWEFEKTKLENKRKKDKQWVQEKYKSKIEKINKKIKGCDSGLEGSSSEETEEQKALIQKKAELEILHQNYLNSQQ